MRLLLFSLLLPTLCLAAETEEKSGSLKEINRRLSDIETRIEKLPERVRYPIGGGLGHGWVMQGETRKKIEWIRLDFAEPTQLTSLSVVPCVNIDATTGFGSYGAPDDLTVSITERGEKRTILLDGKTPDHFSRDGYPLFLSTDSAQVTQIEILMNRAKQSEDIFFCLSEIFAMNGESQVSLRASVSVSSSVRTLSSHYWQPSYLNDGQSSLGQPVYLGSDESRFFRGSLDSSQDESAELLFHLSAPAHVSEVRLFPVFPRANSMKLADYAYGLPERIDCELLDDGGAIVEGLPPFLSDPREFNPTRNLIVFPAAGSEVRSVRLRITETRPPIDQMPTIALGEIQIVDKSGNNLAPQSRISLMGLTEGEGRKIESGIQAQLLSDGKSRWGKILPIENWLRSLGERGRLLGESDFLKVQATALKQKRAERLQSTLTVTVAVVLILLCSLGLARRNRRLELENVKRQIAGDLHDEVGSNIASIGLLSARMRDQPDQSLSDRIEEITRETEEALREIVWVLHPRSDDALPRIREAATRLLEEVAVNFHIDETVDLNRLELRKRHHLILWCKEAFHNIRKHADATKADVWLQNLDDRLKVTIRDNGTGIPEATHGRTSKDAESLAKLHDRTDRIGGVMEVESSKGMGTQLELYLPLSR